MHLERFVYVSSRLISIFCDLSYGVFDFPFWFKLLFEKMFDVRPFIQTEFYITGLKVIPAKCCWKITNTASFLQTRVAKITDFSVQARNSENDLYFSRFLYGVLKFSDFVRILQFFDFFQHFLPVIGNHHSCGALALKHECVLAVVWCIIFHLWIWFFFLNYGILFLFILFYNFTLLDSLYGQLQKGE